MRPRTLTTSTATSLGISPAVEQASQYSPYTLTLPCGVSADRVSPIFPTRPSRPVSALARCAEITRDSRKIIKPASSTAVGSTRPRLSRISGIGVSKSMSAPATKQAIPPSVSRP